MSLMIQLDIREQNCYPLIRLRALGKDLLGHCLELGCVALSEAWLSRYLWDRYAIASRCKLLLRAQIISLFIVWVMSPAVVVVNVI